MLAKQLYYKSTEVAELCGADPKTIHNWVDEGYIEAFRTPGRHLRFKHDVLVKFLTAHGYTIPKGWEEAA